jgi:hypothetical protein
VEERAVTTSRPGLPQGDIRPACWQL